MATIKLNKSEWTVLPEGSGPLPSETMEAFRGTKLRLENILGAPIDIESQEFREQFNYVVFKVALLRIFESLNLSAGIPQSVANNVRQLLSKIRAAYEFQSPKEALSYRFPNGLNLVESLYECGYADAKGVRKNGSGSLGEEPNVPKKNVESIEKIARAFSLDELSEKRKSILRIAGCLNHAVETDGTPSMDCRLAALRFVKGMFQKGGMDPNERIGSYDETPFYLLSKYAVDPRNFESMALAIRLYRALLAEYDAERDEKFAFCTINPYASDRAGTSLKFAIETRKNNLISLGAPREAVRNTHRKILGMLTDVQREYELFQQPREPESPSVRKSREQLETTYGQFS